MSRPTPRPRSHRVIYPASAIREYLGLEPVQITPGEIEPHFSTKKAAELVGLTEKTLRNLRIRDQGPRWITIQGATNAND